MLQMITYAWTTLQVLLFCSAQRALTAYQTKAGGSKLQLVMGLICGLHAHHFPHAV